LHAGVAVLSPNAGLRAPIVPGLAEHTSKPADEHAPGAPGATAHDDGASIAQDMKTKPHFEAVMSALRARHGPPQKLEAAMERRYAAYRWANGVSSIVAYGGKDVVFGPSSLRSTRRR
jgi:hypothetical protein